MARLAPVTFENLDDAQRTLWDNITSGPRGNPDRPHGGLAGEDGALVGPFNALFYSPESGRRGAEAGRRAALQHLTAGGPA